MEFQYPVPHSQAQAMSVTSECTRLLYCLGWASTQLNEIRALFDAPRRLDGNTMTSKERAYRDRVLTWLDVHNTPWVRAPIRVDIAGAIDRGGKAPRQFSMSTVLVSDAIYFPEWAAWLHGVPCDHGALARDPAFRALRAIGDRAALRAYAEARRE